jgi:hypothetical protein
MSSDLQNEETTSSFDDSSSPKYERRLGDCSYAENSVGPLTVFAKQKVVRGKEELFEKWVEKVTQIQQKYAGYLGSEVIRPTCVDVNEYVSIFRYDTYEHLQFWMNSEERDALMKTTCEFVEEPVVIAYHSLEFWFVNDEKGASVEPPPKHKMALIMFFVIWIQANYYPKLVRKIPNISDIAAGALTTAIIVSLTTYIIMPIVTTYFLGWWLFPKNQKKDEAKTKPPAGTFKKKQESV